KSDCALHPVAYFSDPIRGFPNVLVMCEVFLADGKTPHSTNTRALLRAVSDKTKKDEPWFGIEQEYTLFRGMQPLGWPDNGFFAPPRHTFMCWPLPRGRGRRRIHHTTT